MMRIVFGRVRETPAAGGHCIYGAVGSLYVLAPPLNPHHHGSVESQMAQLPGKGDLRTLIGVGDSLCASVDCWLWSVVMFLSYSPFLPLEMFRLFIYQSITLL